MLRAVLDANVYGSAAIRPESPPGRIIERFLREATFQIVLSSAIAEEVLQALAYPKVRKVMRGHLEPELWFEDLLVVSHLVSDTQRALGVCVDPDDDKYISSARGPRGLCGHGRSSAPRPKRARRDLYRRPRGFLDIIDRE